jgi:hypothetical protein
MITGGIPILGNLHISISIVVYVAKNISLSLSLPPSIAIYACCIAG